MWRKSISNSVQTLKINERITAIKIFHDKGSLLLINVYMPFNAHTIDSLHEYRTCIGIIDGLFEETNCSDVLICGDLNADHIKNTSFWSELNTLITQRNLFHMSGLLSRSDFTYLCPASGSTSF